MTTEDPGDALARLREAARAWRATPGEERLSRCGAVLERWRRADSPWQRRLGEALPSATGFSPANVARGLALGLADWSAAALEAVVRTELGDAARLEDAGHDTTALLLAGAIPMPSLQAILAPLLLGSAVLVKPASRDPVTPKLVVESLADDPALAACVAVTRFDPQDPEALDAFLTADCIVATGTDETLAAVGPRVRAPRRWVPRGHRLSVAVLGPEAELAGAMQRLALDVALWDQLGCLSPIALYVVGADPSRCDAAALALAHALEGMEARLPRGAIDAADAAQLVQERAEAEMRAAGGGGVGLHVSAGTAWTVVREADAAPRAAPLHRFVRVHPVVDRPELERALAPLARHLAAIGAEGLSLDTLRGLGAPRLCPLGTLQTPPFSWCHDDEGVLTPLAR